METCDNLPPCYSYQWNAGNWSECEVVGIDCGKGLQTREVHCGRSDGTTVEPGNVKIYVLCYSSREEFDFFLMVRK